MELEAVAQKLRENRFEPILCKDGKEALETALRLIGSASVGFGGSKTVSDIGLSDALAAQGNTLIWHKYGKTPEEKTAIRRQALLADVFACSANAITADGKIIEIDGTGNRVAALLFGPQTLIVIAGKNKLVPDYASAIARIKRDACPENARRLGFRTPCALTGACTDCKSPDRMCNATVLFERPTRNAKHFYVLLVDEDLGM